jgi:hypothetical protein
VNKEEARVKTSGRQDAGHGDEERGVERGRDRNLRQRSIEILHDLGLAKEKIVAYHRRFPTPMPSTGRGPPRWEGVLGCCRQVRPAVA